MIINPPLHLWHLKTNRNDQEKKKKKGDNSPITLFQDNFENEGNVTNFVGSTYVY